MDGLPPLSRMDAERAALQRGLAGKYVIRLSQSIVEPFLTFSARRDLREKVYKAWASRGCGVGDRGNYPVVSEILALRAEQAKLLGYESFADFRLDDTMAKRPKEVLAFLRRIWAAAVERASEERRELIDTAKFPNEARIEAWDWRYFAEKIRRSRYRVKKLEDITSYMELSRIIEAAFYVAQQLFGLEFRRVKLPAYHEDVRTWSVYRRGRQVGLFLGDYFSRPSKSSGSWTTTYHEPHEANQRTAPIAACVLNFIKPHPGREAMLSLEETRLLFHEFGHALHALLSGVTPPVISWVNVPPDFVEFPSKLFEHWIKSPAIMKRFMVHIESGEPLSEEMAASVVQSAKSFNGYLTSEHVLSALLDLFLHVREPGDKIDKSIEAQFFSELGAPDDIRPRYRLAHFGHIFGDSGYYASCYYSYLWAEMLAADAFAVFSERGDPFDPIAADRLFQYVFAAGALREPEDAYLSFRRHLPSVDSLLIERGLLT